MGDLRGTWSDRQSRAAWKSTAVCLLLCIMLCGCASGRPELVIGAEDAEAESGIGPESNAAAGGKGADPAPETEGERVEPSAACIYVYVCGAVASAGVVELPEGSRADDAVRAAGGMTQEADVSYVNLAARVSDGEKLYVPTVQEAEVLSRETGRKESGLLNINTADSAALCTLPGIGESRAADIIAYREAHGGFADIEDIMKVPGIKEAAFGKIKDRITAD